MPIIAPPLPPLSDYSLSQIERLKSVSPAFARYFAMPTTGNSSFDSYRISRLNAWMAVAAASVFETASLKEICFFWSQRADEILKAAWRECGLLEDSVSLFALGKLGACELNLSSDVDLMIVANTPDQGVEKKIRDFRSLIAEHTDLGFCFRIDFDLRPGGPSSSLITGLSQFQEHYWSQGEAWERMALVRFRPLLGPHQISQPCLEIADRFSYRKFLDFGLLEDLKSVRSRIQTEGFNPKDGQIHIKLARGGIRDIELFVNALQVLHGGKISSLKTNSTEEALQQLGKLKLLPSKDVDFLRTTYWDFRRWENLVQAIDDRQTHFLYWPCPWGGQGWPEIEKISHLMNRVDDIVSEFFGPDHPSQEASSGELTIQGSDEDWQELLHVTHIVDKSEKTDRARRFFLMRMSDHLQRLGPEGSQALRTMTEFIRATHAKGPFFHLIKRTPNILENLMNLFSFSQHLGLVFAHRPDLIDNFFLNLKEPLSTDFETMLDEIAERKFLSDIHTAIQFLNTKDLGDVCPSLSQTADEIGTELLKRTIHELKANSMSLLPLGKWGGRELGFSSDLDFIFISKSEISEKEQKVARRFISRLTDPYRGGSLYNIDLRLRPSGKAGPILTTWHRLNEYLANESKSWERQAYLKLRSLDETPFDRSVLWKLPLDVESLKEIRAKLIKAAKPEAIDFKFEPGGLIDVELAVQTSVLNLKLDGPTNTLDMIDSLPWGSPGVTLKNNYVWIRKIEQLLQLSESLNKPELPASSPSAKRVGRILNLTEQALFSKMRDVLNQNDLLLKSLDLRQSSESL